MKQFFTFILFVFLTVPNISYAQVDLQDSMALVDLYNSTNGPGWKVKTNWLTSKPITSWYGVTITYTGTSVYELYLGDNNLVGTLPASLGNLRELYVLGLSNNKLSGSIPATFGNFVNLQLLHLSNNQFSGSIPAGLGSLPNLWFLYLTKNKLSGSIPTGFGTGANFLKHLYLDSNQLTGSIPASLFNCNTLYDLVLTNNKLTGFIPSSINNLYNLSILKLSSNQFSGPIPSTITNLNNLQKLAIDRNMFTFDGMQYVSAWTLKFAGIPTYSPQAKIPLTRNGDTLGVAVGSNKYFNTYKWFRNDTLVNTILGDSMFTPTVSGRYSVAITNPFVNKLTLFSDTVSVVVLPIRSIRVAAQSFSGHVRINWQTLGSANQANFDIQRSLNGIYFESIGSELSVNDENNLFTYTDNKLPESEKLYYKIVATEKDGSKVFSSIVTVRVGKKAPAFSFYPNPVKDQLYINGKGMKSIVILNAAGQIVVSQLVTNSTNCSINVSALTKGMYIIKVLTNNGVTEEERFFK